MKIKILALLFVLALFVGACALKAQSVAVTPATPKVNATVDENGNYKALVKVQAQPTPTDKTFTDSKGTVHKVWISTTGKEFYTRVSAKGNEYPVYIYAK